MRSLFFLGVGAVEIENCRRGEASLFYGMPQDDMGYRDVLMGVCIANGRVKRRLDINKEPRACRLEITCSSSNGFEAVRIVPFVMNKWPKAWDTHGVVVGVVTT